MPKTTKLKELRERKSLLQKDVAEHLGVSVQYYNEIENGRRPSFRLALLIADFFEVPVDQLFRE
ncbi:MAG TPA: helix-turn-helix transcriptional regulator [Symbiobacteriaceae bacterium]|nr:helix-turn-helix transcriptional regulator [Symbiobacteriaceae bacterium]